MARTNDRSKPIEALDGIQPTSPEFTGKTQAVVPSRHVQGGVAAPSDQVLPNQLLTKDLPTPPSMWEAFKTNVAPTGRDWANSLYEIYKYDDDPYYNPMADAQDFADKYGIQESRDLALLKGAGSYEEQQSIQKRILYHRRGNEALGEHPIVGMLAGVVDVDALTLLAPNVGGVVTGGKLAQVGQRIGQAAAAGAGAAYVNHLTEGNQVRSDDERTMDIVTYASIGLLASTKTATKASKIDNVGAKTTTTTPLKESVDTVTVKDVGVVPKKALTLEDGIEAEIASIKGTMEKQAAKSGVLVEADILDVGTVKIPLSNTARTNLIMPDLAKNHSFAAKIMSSADEMYHYTGGNMNNPLNNVLAAPRTQGDNAIYAAAQYKAELDSKLLGVEKLIDKEARLLSGYRAYMPFLRKSHLQAIEGVQEQFGKTMQALDQEVVAKINAGNPLTKEAIHDLIDQGTNTEGMKAILKSYIDSGFAESALALAKRSGLLDSIDDVAAIHARPTYLPVKHDYERMLKLTQNGTATMDEIADMIGHQLQRMYPDLQGTRWVNKEIIKDVGGKSVKTVERVEVPKTFKLNPRQLGLNFIQTQKDLKLGLSDVQTASLTKEQMTGILKGTGIKDVDLEHVVNQIYRGTQQTGTGAPKNFRQRLGWDFTTPYATKSGATITMGDIVDGQAYMNLVDYSRTMSHRMGLADYGIKSQADFQTLTNELLDNLPKGTNLNKARDFLSNVQDQAFGRPVGERLADPVRASNTIAGSMLLGASGLYSLNDLATQTAKLGMLRSMPHILKGMSNVINPVKKLTKGEASDLHDILVGKLSMDGRFKPFMTRYSDDFDVSGATFEYIEHAGQTTRFLNMSEYVKRFQIGTGVGVITSAFKGASKGNVRDTKYLRKTLNMSDSLVKQVSAEYRKHGAALDGWDADVRIAMQQKVFYEMDNMAHTVRAGEVPAFMEHSSVGKVLAPFLTFAFAMQQKVLRNTYMRDGSAGVALVAAVQFPTAVLISMAKNIRDGKEYDEDLAAGAVNALSVAGAFSIPIGIIMNGEMGSSAALAPVDGALGMATDIANGSPNLKSLTHAPLIGSFTGLRAAINAFAEE